LPAVFVQPPLSANITSGTDVTVKAGSSAVVDPVSPKIVTVDPGKRAKFAVSVTVNVFATPDIGVLCWIDLVLKSGTTTKRGLDPFCTQYTFASSAVIDTDVNDAVPDASMLIAGEACAEEGFVIWKANV